MNKYYFRTSGRSSNIRVGRTNQFTCINQILYSPKARQLESLDCTKAFHMDVLIGIQWLPGVGWGQNSATAERSWKVSTNSSRWALTRNFQAWNISSTAPWHSCYPKGERKQQERKGTSFSWGQCGTHLTFTCHFEIPLSQECGEGLQKPGR